MNFTIFIKKIEWNQTENRKCELKKKFYKRKMQERIRKKRKKKRVPGSRRKIRRENQRKLKFSVFRLNLLLYGRGMSGLCTATHAQILILAPLPSPKLQGTHRIGTSLEFPLC